MGGVVNGFRSRVVNFETNDGGNINYTNAINSNLVFDIRVSLNRFVQERRPAELFDPATLGFTATSLAAMRRLPVHTSSHDSEPRCHKAHSIDVGFDQIRLERRAYSSLLHGIGAAYYHAGCRQSYVEHGYDFRVVRENFSTDAYKGGQFFFDGTFTAPASNSSSTLRNVFGRDVAAFLLGIPTTGSGGNASQIDNSINYSVQSLYHGFFFQDDWRLSKILLNLGLRFDLEQGLTERFNRILRGFDLGTLSPIEAQVRAAYTTAFNANPQTFLTASEFRVRGGYTLQTTIIAMFGRQTEVIFNHASVCRIK